MNKYFTKLKTVDRKIWAIVAIVVVLLASFIFWKNNQKYNVGKDIKVTFKGYNGDGDADYNESEINKKLFEYIGKKNGLNDTDIARIEDNNMSYRDLPDIYDKVKKTSDLVDLVKIRLSKSTGLSNGDKIKLKVVVPSKEIPVKSFEKEYKVKGLKKSKQSLLRILERI